MIHSLDGRDEDLGRLSAPTGYPFLARRKRRPQAEMAGSCQIKTPARRADTEEDGAPSRGARQALARRFTRPGILQAAGGFALPDLSLFGPAGMTPLSWLIAFGLALVTWWIVYRAFHGMTVADDAATPKDVAGPAAESATVPVTADGDAILHPRLVDDLDPSETGEWDRFESLEQELAEIAAAESLEIGVTRCAGLLRERWGAAAAAVWACRDGEESTRKVTHQTGLLRANGSEKWDPAQTFEPWMSALGAGELVCIPDVSAEPDAASVIADGIGALAIVPFGESGGYGRIALRGGMVVAWSEALSIGPRQAHWVKRAGRSVDATIEHIRQGESLAAVGAQVRVLLDVGGILAREKDLAGALRALVQTLRDRLGYPVCSILLVDEEKKDLHVACMTG